MRKEEQAKFEKTLSMRDSEIEVLKGMVKANQLQLRSKEKEVVRLKQKVTRFEGLQLANRQKMSILTS